MFLILLKLKIIKYIVHWKVGWTRSTINTDSNHYKGIQ